MVLRDSKDTVRCVHLANGRSTKPLYVSLMNLRVVQYLNLQNLNSQMPTENIEQPAKPDNAITRSEPDR